MTTLKQFNELLEFVGATADQAMTFFIVALCVLCIILALCNCVVIYWIRPAKEAKRCKELHDKYMRTLLSNQNGTYGKYARSDFHQELHNQSNCSKHFPPSH